MYGRSWWYKRHLVGSWIRVLLKPLDIRVQTKRQLNVYSGWKCLFYELGQISSTQYSVAGWICKNTPVYLELRIGCCWWETGPWVLEGEMPVFRRESCGHVHSLQWTRPCHYSHLAEPAGKPPGWRDNEADPHPFHLDSEIFFQEVSFCL